MIKKFTIYGERCSGTNYLQDLIELNFDVELTWKYGWKHFFGFQEEKLHNSDDTLFIYIVRDLVPWLNSLYRNKWHIAPHLRININNFLSNEFYSYNDKSSDSKDASEIMEDRNIYTGNRYKNIFELRDTKIKYLIEDLPNKIKNYIFISYEDLINDFENTMTKIRNKGLNVKKEIQFPLNTPNYIKVIQISNRKVAQISEEIIFKYSKYTK